MGAWLRVSLRGDCCVSGWISFVYRLHNEILGKTELKIMNIDGRMEYRILIGKYSMISAIVDNAEVLLEYNKMSKEPDAGTFVVVKCSAIMAWLLSVRRL